MRNTPLRLRVLSAATALALISSCSLPALAGTFYLEDGSITVTAGEDGNNVKQGDKLTENDKDTTISNRNPDKSTENTVTIKADKDETIDVTLEDVNIEAKDRSAVRSEGTGTVRIELDGNNTLKGGDASKNGGDGYAGLEKKDAVDGGAGRANDGTLIIKDEDNNGSLTATGTGNSAGIGGVGNKDGKKSGQADATDAGRCSENIEIEGGDITAIGAGGGAGIGGGKDGFGKVTIKGGTVNATGGMDGGAGIGGGKADGWSGLGEVEISGGDITASGGAGAAGIGGGQGGDAHVTISDGKVTANGGDDAAAIGTGASSDYDYSYVKISGGEVEAYGGATGDSNGSALGGNKADVAISGGKIKANGTGSAAAIRGNTINISADDNDLDLTVSVTQGEMVDAKNDPNTIFALGERHRASAVFYSNFIESKRTHNAQYGHSYDYIVDHVEPTADKEGYIQYKCACGETYTVVLPKSEANQSHNHVWDNGVVTKVPTLEAEGERTHHCTVSNCTATITTSIPKLVAQHEHTWIESSRVEPNCIEEGYVLYTCDCGGEEREVLLPNGQHSWDAGVVTKEPTTESEGEKLYTCTVCGETYTEVIPKLVVPDDSNNNGDDTPDNPDNITTESESITAWYRVANGAQDYTANCLPQIAGDTCTFATELENATLSGNFAYLQQLYAQGVRTLCFATANRTTKLSLDALLARGEEESVFVLAHTGTAAALTVDSQTADELLG